MHLKLTAVGALAIALFATSPARAHEDPAGCFQTGPAIIVSVFRADGVTGVVGNVSECEPINYQATLQKASNSDTICAFSGGTFSLKTPDGVVHTIDTNVPCIGGNSGLEGCVDTVTNEVSPLIPYTVSPGDEVAGLIVATATYTGGEAHDTPLNTQGVSAITPKSTPVISCNDNNLCTTDICDPTKRGLLACSNPPVVCDDNNACTTDTCNPATGQCQFSAPKVCDDGNACTTDTCNTSTGACEFSAPKTCNDNNACTTDTCNTSTGACEFSAPKTCNDNNACTTDTCNTSTGACEFSAPKTCDDGNACTTDTCNTSTGACEFSAPKTCDDGNACTTDTCNTSTGACEFSAPKTCDDQNPCTDDSCNPATGQCEFVDNNTCHPAICRTPGYWKTHGSVSQQVIDHAGGCLEVCGEVITTATADSVGNANSVLEAMCISPRGEQRLQLARQLTGLALNCVISGFGPDCGTDPSLSDLYNTCNDACINNTADVGDCISAVDCFANGGLFDPNTGLCGTDPSGSCHERALPDFLTTGAADTPQACNAASKNSCTVILGGEASCTSGNRSSSIETCP